MNAILGILKEELERLEKLSQKYKEMIEKLPKGSISIKKRRGHSYAYLAFREQGKVRFKYLGKASSEKVREFQKKIESRKKYESLLKKVKINKKEVKGAIRGKEK
jgi:hypothetical protein